MTAQPVGYDDPRDPANILAALPERAHAAFLSEYEAAVEAARRPEGFHALQELLQGWSVRAVAYGKPGFWEAREAARTGEGRTYSLEEIESLRRSASA